MALNRTAAAQATAAFENRCTAKVYLAVVHGHVFPTAWPTQQAAERNRLPLPFDSKPHEKLKRKHMAAEDRQETWQDRALQISVSRHFEALHDLLETLPKGSYVPNEKVLLSLQSLAAHPKEKFLMNKKLRKELRKVVNACGVQVEEVDQEQVKASMPEQLLPSNQSNDDTSCPQKQEPWSVYGSIYHKYEESCSDGAVQSEPQPVSFYSSVLGDLRRAHEGGVIMQAPHECTCTQGDIVLPQTLIHHTQHEKATLHVDIPIAEGSADEFRMNLGAGSATSPGRPSHTEMTVLEHGFYMGKPVTKLLLRPISGRRHQLRLHTLAIGHPIVGDATYGPEKSGRESARMMLHAFRLRYAPYGSYYTL